MGIRGTVRRSTDGDFIHANVDIDLIIDEEKPYGSDEKPIEIFHMIEHFCLGRRRLHVFGRDSSIRPGWVSIGPNLTSTNYDSEAYNGYYRDGPGTTTGCTEEIERLRPKSPPPKNKGQSGGNSRGAARGRGRGGSSDRGRGSGNPNRQGPGSRAGGPGGWSGRGGQSRGGYGSGRGRGGSRGR